jgi:glycosyltransferase involved in cell wall biosynthesis
MPTSRPPAQPYPDGVTTRRSSFIAGMALGVASVTNRGDGTESLWDQTDGVVLTACSSQALIEATIGLMNDPQRRRDIGQRGREFYRQHFDLCHTVHQLRETVV